VRPIGPVEEGTLGTVPPDADEALLMSRYGGGIYRIQKKDHGGKIAGARTITLSGEPKLKSKDALRQYKILTGELPEEPKSAPAAAPVPGAMGVAEILALMNKSHEQQLVMMRLQIEQSKNETAEREARARRDADEREARARREAEESRQRDREHHAAMLQMLKSEQKAPSDASTAVNLLLRGLALGRELNGEHGAADPFAMLMQNIGPVIEHLKGVTSPAPPAPAAPGAPGRIVLTGESAKRVSNAVRTLMGRGYSLEQAQELAERALALGISQLDQVPNAPPVEPAPAAPVATPVATPIVVEPPAPPAPPPSVNGHKGTRGRARATRGS